MKRFLAAALLPLVAITALASCRSATLTVPEPIVLQDSRSDVRDVILHAMAARGWRVKSEEGSTIRAQIAQRSHVGVVDISYTPTEVSFTHVSSTNLDESVSESGEVLIHKSYNLWLANLRADIELELGLAPLGASAGA